MLIVSCLIASAKASVAIAQANYNKLVNGPTAIDLESINNSIESSQNTLENTKQDILIKLRSAYVSASTAVYINTDSFFVGPNSLIPALSITNVNLLNQDLQSKVEMGRANVGTILQSFKDGIAGESSSSDLVSDLNKYISDLNQFSTYFSNMTDLFSNYTFAGNSTAQSLINTDKSAANSAQSSVNSAISDLTSALQSYKSEILSLQQSENNLGLKTATPSGDDLTVSKSSLDNAEANYQNALSNYESRIIRAPFDGQIGGLNAQIGQQVASNDSLGKIITQDRVVNILLNEVDATKVGANNPVILTFDALPGISVNGHIKYVDPLGVVTQGVVNYSVRVSIDDKNDSIKTGMTASAEITTITHQNVLMVPNSAIITKNGRKFVSVLAASSTMQNQNDFASGTRMFGTSTRNFSGRYGMGSSSDYFGSTTSRMGMSSSSYFGSSTRRMRNSSSTTALSGVTGTTNQIEVEVGISNNIDTEILSGLSEGQVIVVRTITGGTATKTSAAQATSRSVTNQTVRSAGGFQ